MSLLESDIYKRRKDIIEASNVGFPAGTFDDGEFVWKFGRNPDIPPRFDNDLSAPEMAQAINGGKGPRHSRLVEIVRILPFKYLKSGEKSTIGDWTLVARYRDGNNPENSTS